MTLARLYEDIDGCLNAEYNARVWRDKDNPEDLGGYQRGWVTPEYDDYGARQSEYYTSPKYRMEYNDRLIEALNALDVEFVWTTTWREDARQAGTLMGLLHDPQRVLHPLTGQTSFPSIEWKFDAIMYEQDHNPSPFIAVDDEWDSDHGYYRESLESIGGLVICPDFDFGITPKHVAQMRKYLAKL